MEDTIGTTTCPSVNANTDTSGPVINSSITICLPACPNAWSTINSLTAWTASSSVCAINTPLPSANPSAFNTVG